MGVFALFLFMTGQDQFSDLLLTNMEIHGHEVTFDIIMHYNNCPYHMDTLVIIGRFIEYRVNWGRHVCNARNGT